MSAGSQSQAGAAGGASVQQRVVDWPATARHAAELGVQVNVAVVDCGGNLAALLRRPASARCCTRPRRRPSPTFNPTHPSC